MKSKNSAPLVRRKLCASSLFRTYKQAFELATGYCLDLQEEVANDAVAVPVHVGRLEPFFLVAELPASGQSIPVRGLLESFALQLGDEANRAMLESHGADPSSVKAAKQYIHDHLSEKIQLNEVAEVVGVGSFQLCRLFKKHTEITMTEYVNRQRIEKARNKLQLPGLQISETAYDVGFTSLSQFNRIFLKYTGESPSEYRDRLEELERCDLATS